MMPLWFIHSHGKAEADWKVKVFKVKRHVPGYEGDTGGESVVLFTTTTGQNIRLNNVGRRSTDAESFSMAQFWGFK